MADIGNRTVEPAIITGPKRHAPKRVMGMHRGGAQPCGKRVTMGIKRRDFRPHGDAGGAGQRGEIDHHIRAFAIALGQHIGQHQPAFGIGIANFNTQPFAAFKHIARAKRIRANGVFNRANHQAQAHRQLRVHHRIGQRNRQRRAAHILLHQIHIIAGLQIETARIKANALADKRQLRRGLIAPNQIEKTRGFLRGAPNGVNHRIILRQQIIAANDTEFGFMGLCKTLHHSFQSGRPHIGGRCINEMTRRINRPIEPVNAPPILTFIKHEARPVALMFGFLIKVETITAQRPSQSRHIGHGLRRGFIEAISPGR